MTADPLWYKDAVIYEVPVRAFHDADGSGNGDLIGLTQKLDYLEDLGVTAIWILPFYPSPLKDDGYDISDYTSVNPLYGTLDDFKAFLVEAHRRGLHVITELVINHTSDAHPWFQRARRSLPGSVERDFYVWSDSPEKYANVPRMFPEFESSNWAWDAVAKQYYWHRFYAHQPDLNFDNPAVWEALLPVVDFWMELGVDGMRLDAVPYLYEREGTTCEHLPETHTFLKALRAHVDERFPNRMFIAEANAWPEDAVPYFGDGDECQMAFHFPLMPRLFMALQQEDRFPILDIFAQTPPIPDTAQWCLFLRNHDELTLAMVTDEERDSMFRAYARDQQSRIFLGIRHRLAPLMRNDRRRIELMNALLLSLPGTPVIYYGDEIGMGDNIYLGDRNGVRTPMQWSADRNAGFSRANPQKLYLPIILDPEYHYEAVNVESQQSNPSSLLWWMKRLIALRKECRALSRGRIEFLRPDNPKVLAYIRQYESETILVVANLSRFVQYVELDLKAFEKLIPEELHSHGRFPAIGTAAYPLALGPHGYYWFALRSAAMEATAPEPPMVTLAVAGPWSELVDGVARDDLEAALPRMLAKVRPYRDGRTILNAKVMRSVKLTVESPAEAFVLSVRVETQDHTPDTISLPLTFVPDGADESALPVLARIIGPQPGLLCDAMGMRVYLDRLVMLMATHRQDRGGPGVVVGERFGELPLDALEATPALQWDDAGNLTATYAARLQVKIFRRLDDGVHSDGEAARVLPAERLVPLVGRLDYQLAGANYTLAIARPVPASQGTAWEHSQQLLSRYFDRASAVSHDAIAPPELDFSEGELMAERMAGLLAAVHRTMAASTDAAFALEPFTRTYQRSVYQTMRTRLEHLLRFLRSHRDRLPAGCAVAFGQFLDVAPNLDDHFRKIATLELDGQRIRCHGDLHLGRLLFTGDHFLLADFEGEVGNSLGERRIKRSPLRDLASLLRSLDYVVAATVHGLTDQLGRAPGGIREVDRSATTTWARQWLDTISRQLVAVYRTEMATSRLLPSREEHALRLLNLFQLDRAILELESDLKRRPEWSFIPLEAILRLVGESVSVGA